MKNIIEELEMAPDIIVEAKAKTILPESLHFRARALKLDTPTGNGRIYKKSLIEREVQRLAKNPLSIFGGPFHPASGQLEADQVSHIISKLEVGNDGYLWCEGEILNTLKGKDLKAIITAGGKIGLSCRGTGKIDNKTGVVDEESYRLVSVDAVLRPASEGAHLSRENIFESLKFENENDVDREQQIIAEQLEAEQEKRVVQLVEEARLSGALLTREEASKILGKN